MHRVLERQYKKYFGDSPITDLPKNIQDLLLTISNTYENSDSDRDLLLRSLDLSSKEFVEVNSTLKKENEIIEKKVQERTSELAEEKTKLNEIAEYMSTGAILLDTKGQVTFVNKAAIQTLGTSIPQEIIAAIITHFSTVPVLAHITTSLSGTSVNIEEAEAFDKIFSLSFVSLKSENGIFGSLIWLNDITQQKVLERAKNQFIAIASHEMRTPLAIIRGNAELMKDDDRIKSQEDLLGEVLSIHKSSIRLLDIVNDFLDVQNLEAGKVVLKNEPVDVIHILEDTIRDLTPMATEKNIYLTYISDTKGPLPPILLDQYRLQQIFINIISNAIHYTKEGGITVTLTRDEHYFSLYFSDTGAGISADDQKRLFKKFETGASFLRSKEYGSGLGLYISHMLAALMGVTLSLDKSEIGKGSTFVAKFPIT